MQFRMLVQVPIRRFVLAACVMPFTISFAQGSELTVRVLDRAGTPVEDAVVIVERIGESVAPEHEPRAAEAAIVDQKDQQFIPQVTAIRTGTAVVFPNSDSIAHQVYSFSPAKRFELGLYRGRPHPPVTFDQPGIVVLGCNIHDSMIGYIYVTDAAYFGTSDAKGEWHSDSVLAGTYRLTLWSPRLAKRDTAPSQTISIEKERAQTVVFQFNTPLRGLPGQKKDSRVRDY